MLKYKWIEDDYMSTEFRLYNVEEKELFDNKTKVEKEQILLEMVECALAYGYKPTARKYSTYPATVRRWVKIYKQYGKSGLKLNKRRNALYEQLSFFD